MVGSPSIVSSSSQWLRKRRSFWIGYQKYLVLMSFVFGVIAGQQAYALNRASFLSVYDQLSEGDVAGAQAILDNLSASSNSPEYCFLKVIIDNKAGNYDSAIAEANRCHSLQFYHPRLYFESAWAAFKLNRMALAKEKIEIYQFLEPNDEQGQRLYKLIFSPSDAEDETSTQSPVELSLDSPFKIWLGTFGGYNDNVIGLADGYPVPSDISDERAFFLGLRGNFSYKSELSKESAIDVSYRVSTRFYESLGDFNSQFHQLNTSYSRRLSQALASRVGVEFNNYVLGGTQYRHQYLVTGEVFYRGYRRYRTIIRGEFGLNDFKYPANVPDLRRDGQQRELKLVQERSFSSSRIAIEGGVGDQSAKGDEYDYDYWRTSASFSYWLNHFDLIPTSGRPMAKVSVSYRDESYDESSLFSSSHATKDRELTRMGIYFGIPVREDLNIYVSYSYTSTDSNVGLFEYSQNNLSFGVNSRF